MRIPQPRAAALLIGSLSWLVPGVQASPGASQAASRAVAGAETPVPILPLLFVENRGQFPEDTSFRASIPGATVSIHNDGWSLGNGMRMRFVRADAASSDVASAAGEDPRATRMNYLLGTARASVRGAATFGRVRVRNMAPGVDLVFSSDEGRPEYDLELAPGVPASKLAFRLEGVERAAIDCDGSLLIEASGVRFRERAPVSFEVDGSGLRHPLSSRFVQLGDDRFGFEVDGRDPARPLVIDPVLVYSTLVGGSGADEATAVAVDMDGGTYVAGWARSSDFPGADHAPRGRDVVVFKLRADASSFEYVTLLGGSSDEEATDLTVDDLGQVTLVGWTQSKDFPTTRDAYLRTRSGGKDAFCMRLAADGASVVWSTYLGGGAEDIASSVAVSDRGAVFVVGTTSSKDYPVTSRSLQTELAGGRDAFVTQVGAAGKVIVYSTFLGGMRDDYGRDVALDTNGNAYVVGRTDSPDFPTTTGAFDLHKSGIDGFVTKLSLSGAALSFSSFLGGSEQDEALSIALDADQEPWIAGWTQSSDFPTSPDAMLSGPAGHRDGFAVRVSTSGGSLVYASYLGGEGADEARAVAIDSFGSPWFTGETTSDHFPVTPDAAQESRAGGRDGFLLGIDAATGSLAFGTYMGSGGHESGDAVATEPFTGAVVLAGTAADIAADDRGRLGGSRSGPSDALVARFEPLLCGQAAGRSLLGGPAGVVLDATPPRLGKPFRISVEGGPPNAPGYVLLGPAGAASSLLEGFAELHLDPTRTRLLYSFVTDSNGAWTLEIVLPRRSSLCGTSIVLQAIVLDRSSGPLSFGALSEGIQLTLGD